MSSPFNRRQAVSILGAGLALSGCTPRYQTRYRLSLEVDTPEGLRRGASVFEQLDRHMAGPAPMGVTLVRGEAAFVELPGHGVLAALLRQAAWRDADGAIVPTTVNWKAYDVFAQAYGIYSGWRDGQAPALEHIRRGRAAAEVSVAPRQLPMLVRVRDPQDPGSIVLLDPRNIDSEFGPGFRLRAARLGITADPRSHKIASALPWADVADPEEVAWTFLPSGIIAKDFIGLAQDLRAFKTEKWA